MSRVKEGEVVKRSRVRSELARGRRMAKYYDKLKFARKNKFLKKYKSQSVSKYSGLDKALNEKPSGGADKPRKGSFVENSVLLVGRVQAKINNYTMEGVLRRICERDQSLPEFKRLLEKEPLVAPSHHSCLDNSRRIVLCIVKRKLVSSDKDLLSVNRIKAPTRLRINRPLAKILINTVESVNIASFNVRSLSSLLAIPRLVETALHLRCSVIAVQEHRLHDLKSDEGGVKHKGKW